MWPLSLPGRVIILLCLSTILSGQGYQYHLIKCVHYPYLARLLSHHVWPLALPAGLLSHYVWPLSLSGQVIILLCVLTIFAWQGYQFIMCGLYHCLVRLLPHHVWTLSLHGMVIILLYVATILDLWGYYLAKLFWPSWTTLSIEFTHVYLFVFHCTSTWPQPGQLYINISSPLFSMWNINFEWTK